MLRVGSNGRGMTTMRSAVEGIVLYTLNDVTNSSTNILFGTNSSIGGSIDRQQMIPR